MGYTDLEGALVKLKLVTAAEVPKLFARRDFLELWDEPPNLETLKRRILKDRNVVAWEVHPITGGGCKAFIGVIATGSPFIFVEPLGEHDYALWQDAMLTPLPAFFANSREDALYIHVNIEIDDDVRPMLIEGGFDPMEIPGYPPDKYCSYGLLRETYDIYYRGEMVEGSDDEMGGEEGDAEEY